MLSRRPVAALPTAEARRPTARPLTPARGGVPERAVPFAGGLAPRGPEAAAPIAPARPTDRPVLTSPPGRAEAIGGAKPLPGFHGAVTEFKRRLIETTLTELGGNRTRAARALGLQRTYLLRLMREFAVHVPAGTVPPRRGAESPVTAPAPPRER